MKYIPPKLMEEIINRLVHCLQPEKIILFGSHAYGKPAEISDIDLLIVISDSDEPRYRRARKAYSCLRGLTAPTELLVLTHKEVQEGAKVYTSLVNQVLQRGKVLYG